MERDFRKGYVEIDFPVESMGSPLRLLGRSLRLFFANLSFLAAATFAVFLPGKLLLQAICAALGIAPDGVLGYSLLSASDLLLSALLVPAVIYGMAMRFRTGKPAPLGESLRWGRRMWAKALWNMFQVEVTVLLWSLLLFVPGIVAFVRLAVVDPIVALEADRERDPLNRSRSLTDGHRWRVFGVVLPLGLLDLVTSFAVLNAVEKAAYSRVLLALSDSVLALCAQWMTLALLLVYLAVREPVSDAPPRASESKTRRSGTWVLNGFGEAQSICGNRGPGCATRFKPWSK